MAPLRIAFIGAGFIANRHADVMRTFDDVQLVAVADPALERAGEMAARMGGKAFSEYEEMLEAEPVDAVFVCVPPFAHGGPERALAERELPFFVEKPLAVDLETAEAIAELVDRHSLVTGVGYHWRYLDTFERTQELLADRPARLITGYWLDTTPPPAWWQSRRHSGGQTIEQTTHVLDLARSLVGDVTRVYAAAGHTPRAAFPDADVADVSTATLQFATGAVGSVSSTCLLNWRHRVAIHLFCEGMAIELSEFDVIVDVGAGRPLQAAVGDPVARQDRAFLDAVRGRGRVKVPYHEALRTHRLATTVARSAAEGRPLDVLEVADEVGRV